MGQFNPSSIDPLGKFNLSPMPTKSASTFNYIDFTGDAGGNFAQQYLPEIYEAEVERYGNRTLSGFLRMVGAEMPMTSDQIVWSEQNRLHIGYKLATGGSIASNIISLPTNGDDGLPTKNAIRVKNTVVLQATAGAGAGTTVTAYVNAISGLDVTLFPYTAASLTAAGFGSDTIFSLFVYGSEFAKGTGGMSGSLEASFTQYSNKPIIIKDNYEINGSDASQIGWVEVAAEDGTNGYLWYLKSEGETRLRFQDYLEMAMVEGELATNAAVKTAVGNQDSAGTEGLFAAITSRGNVYQNYASGITAAGARTALGDFDAILANLDKQGAIEENMMFLDRATSLDFDDMLAAQNSYGAGGTSYGVFENSQEMALNLGFDGFRRGSYDFYKTDWKYLNDASTRGLIDNVEGVMVPAGTSTVYDQMLGTNIRRPFLHVRYRASEADDRRMKSWITGSVGGASTTDEDVMRVNFLSERCLVAQATNNFVLFTKTA